MRNSVTFYARTTVILLLVFVLVVIGTARGIAYGKRVGAKIAIQGDYRLSEVEASCDTDHLFGERECARCH